jgi:maleamate amidohydrolase
MAEIEAFEDHCWKDVVDRDTLTIYSAYARRTFVGPSPAIIAVDLYNSAYRGGRKSPLDVQAQWPSSCGINAWNALEPTKRLLAVARRAGIPIFYSTSDARPQSKPGGVEPTRRQRMTSSADDYEIHPELSPAPEDVVIVKQRASAFAGTPLGSHLTMLGVRSLIVCGESTSGCVRATCIDGYSGGYHISVVEECTFDRSDLIHKINLFDLHHKYADVMKADEVLHYLGGLATARGAGG